MPGIQQERLVSAGEKTTAYLKHIGETGTSSPAPMDAWKSYDDRRSLRSSKHLGALDQESSIPPRLLPLLRRTL